MSETKQEETPMSRSVIDLGLTGAKQKQDGCRVDAARTSDHRRTDAARTL